MVLLDVLRGMLETRTVPTIKSGHRLVPVGRVRGVLPLTLVDGTLVEPGEDIPLALAAAQADGRLRPGHLVLMEALGGGLTWGSALVRM